MAADALTGVPYELNEFARANRPALAEGAVLPRLTAWVGGKSGPDRTDAIRNLVRQAVEDHADRDLRRAAEIMFFPSDGWRRRFYARKTEVATKVYVVGRSTFDQVPRSGGRSPYHQFLHDVARLVAAVANEGQPAPAHPTEPSEPASTVDTTDVPTTGPTDGGKGRGGRRWALAAVVAALGAASVGAYIVVRSDSPSPSFAATTTEAASTSSSPATTTTLGLSSTLVTEPTIETTSEPPTAAAPEPTTAPTIPCSFEIGEGSLDLSPEDMATLAAAAPLFAEAGAGACSSRPVGKFGDALEQDLVVDGRPAGAILFAPEATPLRLTQSEWRSYNDMALRDPERARELGGYPISIDTTAEGTIITLSLGGVLVGEDPDGVFFWIPQIGGVFDMWIASGGTTGTLGLPTSSVFPTGDFSRDPWYDAGWYLEFERGYMFAPDLLVGDPQVTVTFVDDVFAPLTGLGDIEGHILRQVGGEAWFIDADRVAHWIPTGGVFNCLGGNTALLQPDTPGYTIASLERGPTATCDLATG